MSRRTIVLKLTPEEAGNVGMALAIASVDAFENPVMSNRHARILGQTSDRLMRAVIAEEVNDDRYSYHAGQMTRVEALHSIAASIGDDMIGAAELLDRAEDARPRDFRGRAR